MGHGFQPPLQKPPGKKAIRIFIARLKADHKNHPEKSHHVKIQLEKKNLLSIKHLIISHPDIWLSDKKPAGKYQS